MIEKIKLYFQGVVQEGKKVTWPTRKQVKDHSIVVIVSIVASMIVFGLVDLGFSNLLSWFLLAK